MRKREILAVAGGGVQELDDSLGRGNEQRKIGPEGVDGDGNLCYWTGFDKARGMFWGKPKTETENGK